MARRKQKSETLVTFMKRIITLLKKNGQHSTMQHYKATLNSLMRFRDNKDMTFDEIDSELIRSYEAYLKNVANVCRNTSSFYMRIIRAVYNRAVEKGLATQQSPFKHVYTGIDKTRKRAVSSDTIKVIKHLDLSDSPMQEMAQYIFLMCVYLQGISFIDLAHLRKTDIRNGILYYVRSKTGRQISVKWEKAMQEIVDKFQHLTRSSPYLFPFLVSDSDDPKEEKRLYHNAQSRIAYHLKKVGAKVGMSERLTLYVARHSWATMARDMNTDLSVISCCLGHDSIATTQIYLDTIMSAKMYEANAKILAAIR